MQNWRPTANIQMLRTRANIIDQIRDFFRHKNVLEVDTPALSSRCVTDIHLHSFDTQFRNPLKPDETTLYLQTSPEFAMKRLLCAGSGAIFQISKAFRNEEAGRFHNPEFTMLEWYQPGYDDGDLMDEVSALVSHVLGCKGAEKISYQNAFLTYLDIDPLESDLSMLQSICERYGYANIAQDENNNDTLLQLLFSELIEPQIGQDAPCFVYDFPASQAALARIKVTDARVASRFELYFKGIELANGFHELTDVKEQGERFANDNLRRKELGLAQMPIDEHLLSAMETGLPDCAGVALGVDRLIMLATSSEKIADVLSFSIDRA